MQKNDGNLKRATAKGFLWGGMSNAVCQLLNLFFGIYLAVDVWEAYRFFHQVLFYGKSNWLFDITRDGILAILPQQFFIDCGVMIGISVVTLSLIFIICSITAVILAKKHKNLQKNV